MLDADRFRLLGTCHTPRVKVGAVLTCESRDCDVIVVGYSDGRIPWPVGRRRGTSARGLLVFGQLVDAVKCESNLALCHWFGVTPQTVSKWRKALGVGLTNDGTHRLRSDYTREPWAEEARAKGLAKAGDPKQRRKMAETKRGRKRPKHVVDAIRKARKGRRHTAEARAKISAASRARGAWPPAAGRPWTPDEDNLVRSLPASEVAQRTGRTLTSVYSRRLVLGPPDGRVKNGRKPRR